MAISFKGAHFPKDGHSHGDLLVCGLSAEHAPCRRAHARTRRAGVELMHMIKKKQMVLEAEDEGRSAADQFYSLAA